MTQWLSTKARVVLSALLRIDWKIKRQSDTSHRILTRSGWSDFTFVFHDKEELGPRIITRIAKHTGLTPGDL